MGKAALRCGPAQHRCVWLSRHFYFCLDKYVGGAQTIVQCLVRVSEREGWREKEVGKGRGRDRESERARERARERERERERAREMREGGREREREIEKERNRVRASQREREREREMCVKRERETKSLLGTVPRHCCLKCVTQYVCHTPPPLPPPPPQHTHMHTHRGNAARKPCARSGAPGWGSRRRARCRWGGRRR